MATLFSKDPIEAEFEEIESELHDEDDSED